MDNAAPTVKRSAFREQMAELVAGQCCEFDGDDPCWAVAATQAMPADWWPPQREGETSAKEQDGVVSPPIASGEAPSGEFRPPSPTSISKAGITESQIEALILKFLSNRSIATGREITEQIKLPFRLLTGVLRRMKEDRLVVYKAEAPMSDYAYELTELGFERARRHSKQCTYFGAAPVPLDQYAAGVRAQSVRKNRLKIHDLHAVFGDLSLNDEILSQLGQAVSSGLGLFLHGAPGNGKTSIAERISKAFGQSIWIPRAICALGEIIRLYDPISHEALPTEPRPGQPWKEEDIDHRWVCIRRPTIVVGGELTMENLEITTNRSTGLSEAPLQLKSNGGTLVIDDFGRQRISPADLLNRWIVPLEKRYDFLNLASGRKTQVPFDQLVIFSTNLEPKDLVDEAFLRRIPYKIDVRDPSEGEFRELFGQVALSMGIKYSEDVVDYLLETHYRAAGRSMRFCHPRDLLYQACVFCEFHERPLCVTRETIDAAVKNYFAMM